MILELLMSDMPNTHVHVGGKYLPATCRRLGISYIRAITDRYFNGYGMRVKYDGVFVLIKDRRKLVKAISDIKAKKTIKARRQREAIALAHVTAIEEKFPMLSKGRISSLLNKAKLITTMEELPFEFLFPMELRRLGLKTDRSQKDKTAAVVSADGKVRYAFMPTVIVKAKGRGRRLSEQMAIWLANKMVKVFPSFKRAFYRLKDEFMRRSATNLIEGRFVRSENSYCYCGGRENCFKCMGSGIYLSKDLYEHIFRFPGDQKVYSFHSYTKPTSVSSQPGANLLRYGYRISDEDFNLLRGAKVSHVFHQLGLMDR